MSLGPVNVIGVLLAALSSFILGGAWYSALFAKAWARETGLTDNLRTGTAKVFVVSFLLALIQALSLELFLGSEPGIVFGLMAGGAVGVTWVATAFGINYLFERKGLRLYAINAAYNILAFLLMGGILSVL